MRPAAATIGQITPRRRQLFGFEFAPIDDKHIAVEDVTLGMVTALDRSKVPPGAGQLVQNGRVRDRWVGRREGTSEYIAKPNSNTVRKVATFFTSAGDRIVIRIATGSMHVAHTDDTWSAIGIGSLNLPNTRYNLAQFLDNIVIAEIQNRLRYLQTGDNTLREIDGSPFARYVANFGDRVVAAYVNRPIGGLSTTGIAWSANADPFEWRTLDDNDEITGAGEDNLAGSATDFGDPITGLHRLSNELVIMRERSIWHASRRPIASAPFQFTGRIEGTGCDLPFTSVNAFQDAVIFASWADNAIYLYQPGSRPQKISDAIDDELFKGLQSRFWCESTWDPQQREYHLGLVTSNGSDLIQKTWVWNADTRAWTFDDGPVRSTLGSVIVPVSSTSIDELVGTIDAQTEIIDELGTLVEDPVQLMAGMSTGEVLRYDFTTDDDIGSVAFEFIWESRDLAPSGFRATFKRVIAILRNAGISGSITFENSRDGVTWSNARTVTLAATAGWLKAGSFFQAEDDHLHWRIRASTSGVRMYEYMLKLLQKSSMQL